MRLGGGLDANGLLTEGHDARPGLPAPLLRSACRASRRSRCAPWPRRRLREARNRDAFLRAQTVLGHPIEVISGREEARLIYAGVARLQPRTRRASWSTSAGAPPR